MSRFNLIDEPWISVVIDYKGTTKLVGLKEFFENAHTYIALAGDMPTQDFAVMRFILAILHTVFSRYDAQGNAYEMVTLNERMQQREEVDQGDYEEYEDALLDTWKDLWKAGKFPDIVVKYLDVWHDRFYLYDDKHPFYQVTANVFSDAIMYNQKGFTKDLGHISFKTINRLVSEIQDNTSMFSMVTGSKDELTDAQLTRWIIHYMGYSTTPDKTKIKSLYDAINIDKYTGHKGWLYAISGLHYKTNSMFETLLLNLILVHPEEQFRYSMQTPAWEFSPRENVMFYLQLKSVDNLARLYTDYSRAMQISKELDKVYGRCLDIVQLPVLDKNTNFLECMTVWKYKTDTQLWTSNENKPYESLWRNFGMIYHHVSSPDGTSTYRNPGIVEWIRSVSKVLGSAQLKLAGQGYESDKKSSNLMVNEMYDELYLNMDVANDDCDHGWVVRIRDTVENIKQVIDNTSKNSYCYKRFIEDIVKLEKGTIHLEKPDAVKVNQYMNNIYYQIDKPFRDWLSSIEINENKDDKINQWNNLFRKLMFNAAQQVCVNLSTRMHKGVNFKKGKKLEYMNVATIFNKFVASLNKVYRR